MVEYRLYCLEKTGHISFAETISAHDDHEAVAKAYEMKRGSLKCEVWHGHRLVALLDAEALGASAPQPEWRPAPSAG